MLVSGATRTLRRLGPSPHLGFLLTPRAANSIGAILDLGLPLAADNDCFSGFNERRFVNMLGRLRGVQGLLWVACPDRVEDAATTLDLFEEWQPVIAAHGLPVALVAQDGLEDVDVPWGRLDALFVGGSTAWKLGEHARRLVGEAKARGKLVHMGRVNSRRRLRLAAAWGVDTCDGSSFSRFPDKKIPKGLRWIEEAEAMKAEGARG